jgi:signal transduction histidine kinase
MTQNNPLANSDFLIKNRLLQGLGFELRSLLNGFAGPLHLLKQKANDSTLVDIFRLLDSSLSRLERLSIRSTLVSKIDTDSFTFNMVLVNVADIVRYSILELQSISDLENVKLKIISELPEIMVQGDYDSLKQVFEILLENTISLSEENTTISIRFLEDNENTICTITPQSATLPMEISLTLEQMGACQEILWNLMMVKKLLSLNDALIRIIEDSISKANSIEITFKKHL